MIPAVSDMPAVSDTGVAVAGSRATDTVDFVAIGRKFAVQRHFYRFSGAAPA